MPCGCKKSNCSTRVCGCRKLENCCSSACRCPLELCRNRPPTDEGAGEISLAEEQMKESMNELIETERGSEIVEGAEVSLTEETQLVEENGEESINELIEIERGLAATSMKEVLTEAEWVTFKKQLKICRTCSRQFLPQRIGHHAAVCSKNATSRLLYF